jgi:uncharacterized membrane protein YoaT (DUF817 family)
MTLITRLTNSLIIVGAAALASIGIVYWHGNPLWLSAVCALILAMLVVRFHELRDLIGLAVGATLGNIIELACDAAGVWRHADRSVMGLAPAYIFFCYPILGLATPRLTDCLVGDQRSAGEHEPTDIPIASALLAGFVVLSVTWAHAPLAQSLACAGMLILTLWQFHSRHDLLTAIGGATIALIWEMPATYSGAWSFPAPQLFGLIPMWLPAAYAIFFVTMGRLIGAASTEATLALIAVRRATWTIERQRDLALVSGLIAGAVAGVCLFFSMPMVCALASGIVLTIALWRWHTGEDIAIVIAGAIIGPVLEYFATSASLWVYPYTTVGLLPAWVFTLWPAFPLCLVRLTTTLWPVANGVASRYSQQALLGFSILAIEIPLLSTFGNTRPVFTAGMTTLMLCGAAIMQRSPQTVLMLALSGGFGMLCELLPIALGAWVYPPGSPLAFPLWLPTGYALFGFGLVQFATGLRAYADARVDQRATEYAVARRQPPRQSEQRT